MASVAEEIAQAAAAQPGVNSGTSAQHDGEMNEDAEREKALQSESNSLQRKLLRKLTLNNAIAAVLGLNPEIKLEIAKALIEIERPDLSSTSVAAKQTLLLRARTCSNKDLIRMIVRGENPVTFIEFKIIKEQLEKLVCPSPVRGKKEGAEEPVLTSDVANTDGKLAHIRINFSNPPKQSDFRDELAYYRNMLAYNEGKLSIRSAGNNGAFEESPDFTIDTEFVRPHS